MWCFWKKNPLLKINNLSARMYNVRNILSRSYLTSKSIRSLSQIRTLSLSQNRNDFRIPYLLQKRKDLFQMGGKIGIETMIDQEKHTLAELICHSSKYSNKLYIIYWDHLLIYKIKKIGFIWKKPDLFSRDRQK